jgi:co-chaperonin GroES (HSP10)
MSTTPVLDHIYVEKPEHTKQGALYINSPIDPAAPRLAKVISVGAGRFADNTGVLIPMPDVRPGDWILMHGNEGIRLTSEGEAVYAIQPRAIIGKQV